MAKVDILNNSNAAKQQEAQQKQRLENKKPLKKIVSGEVKVQKPSKFKIFMSNFIQTDGKDLKEYMMEDVLIPTIKHTIRDVVDLMLDGRVGGRPSYPYNRINYAKPSIFSTSSQVLGNRAIQQPREKLGYQYSTSAIIMESRADAEQVLACMLEQIEDYGMVAVSDLNQLVGITGQYTDVKYGWTNLNGAYVDKIRGGFTLHLPQPKPIV